MIPILYESYETEFTTNGIGRLRDVISFVVHEERNGVYEADFEVNLLREKNHKDIKKGLCHLHFPNQR